MQTEAVSFSVTQTNMQTGEFITAAQSDPPPMDPASWVDDHGDCLFRYALVRLRDESDQCLLLL